MFLVLNAKRYSFKNDDGELVEGTTLQYLDPEEEVQEANRRGAEVLTITAPVDFFDQLHTLPGSYDLNFRQRPGKNGRPTLAVTSARFSESVNLGQIQSSFSDGRSSTV
jgi:hypothetical protein